MKIFIFSILLSFSFLFSFSQHPGNALDFDGTNDIVNCGSNTIIDDLSSFTVEAWINPRTFGGGENGIIIQKRDVVVGYWMLSMQNTGGEEQIEFIVNCTSPARARSSVGSVELNRWMHVAAVFDGSTKQTSLYINGIEVVYDMHVTGTGVQFPDADNSLFIGSNVGTSRIFDGAIDEVRIWNSVKSAAEILANFNNVVATTATNLVAYYRFDEGTPCENNSSTTSLPDLTGNLNTGTLSNFDLATADCTSNWISSYGIIVPYPINPTITDCDEVSFSWTAPTLGVLEKYYLEVAEDADFANRVSGYDPYKDMGTSLSETVNGLATGQDYFFRVRAFHSSNGDIGGYSEIKSILLEDTENPLISCPGNQIIDRNENCEAIVPDYSGLATASDNCSTPVVSQIPAPGTTVSANTTIQLTATDNNENSASCSFDMILEDNTNPTLACPGNQTAPAASGCDAVLSDYISLAIVSDNCDLSPTLSQSPVSGTNISITTTVTITALDDDGNQTQCSFTVTPADATAPSLSCPGNQTEAANENCELVLPDYTTMATVSDLCDANPSVEQSPASGTIVSTTTSVTITATDAGGNSNNCNFSVFIEDQTAPTGTNPGDQGVTPNALCNATIPDFRSLIGATDNCDASVTVNQVPAIGTAMTGTTVITLYAIDDDGNFSTFVFNAYLDDTTNPNVNCPGDQYYYAPANCEILVEDFTGSVMASDNCDDDPVITQSPIAGSIINETTTVTITATDVSGNEGICQFDLIVTDITNPVMNCPGDIYACSSNSIVNYVVSATDNCFVSIEQTAGLPNNSEFPLGETVNTFLATDGAGNTNSCSFSVFVVDNPEVSIPDDTICQYQTNSLDATPSEPGTYSYNWSSGETSPIIEINLEAGLYNYYVTVTNAYDCATIDSIEITVEICEGISTDKNSEISVYPNPTNGLVYIETKSLYLISIKDIAGKSISEQVMTRPNEVLDTKNLLPGIYILEFRNEKEKLFVRLIRN